MRNLAFAGAGCAALAAFLLQLAEIAAKHTCFCDFAQPASWADLFRAGAAGVTAFGAALATNLPDLKSEVAQLRRPADNRAEEPAAKE